MIKHWSEFRDYLLKLKPNLPFPLENLLKFFPSKELVVFDRQSQDSYRLAAGNFFAQNAIRGTTAELIDPSYLMQLALWSHQSRMVLSLNEDSFYSFTDRKETYSITWDSLIFPYDSFVIEIPPGLVTQQSDNDIFELRSLLVTIIRYSDGSERLLARQLWENVDPIKRKPRVSQKLVECAERLVRKKFSPDAIVHFSSELRDANLSSQGKEPRRQGRCLSFDLGGVVDSERDDETIRMIKRIIAGSCAFMNCAREGEQVPGVRMISRVAPERKIHPRRPTLSNVITDRAEVLSLRHIRSFSVNEKRLSYRDPVSGLLVSAHVVRAHRRRKPHAAKDAPREVAVASHWKAIDSIPEGSIPGVGAVVIKKRK